MIFTNCWFDITTMYEFVTIADAISHDINEEFIVVMPVDTIDRVLNARTQRNRQDMEI